MPNRQQPPLTHPIRSLALPVINELTLDNGLPVYCIADAKQEVVKMEWVFRAGRPYEERAMVARQTQLMLRSGSRQFSREQLAEKIDYLGSSLSLPFHLDTAQIAVYSLYKHLPEIMAIMADMLQYPTFSKQELAQLSKRQEAQLEVELEKNEVVAHRQITELLFGATHPYGYNSSKEGYRLISREQLVHHYEAFYHPANTQVFIGGNIQEKDIALLNKFFGQQPVLPAAKKPVLGSYPELPKVPQMITGSTGVQSAIRLGRRLFTYNHPDYAGLYVLNTVLGGYFGSRLMTNIREEKGLTYNVHSSLDIMHYDGMWLIGCEVSPEHTQTTLGEIEREMDRLQTEYITEAELEMVRNYLLGNMLTMLDGPLNSMEVIMTLKTEGLTDAFFHHWVDTIIRITPEELRALARQYLPMDDWVILVVEGVSGKNPINPGRTMK